MEVTSQSISFHLNALKETWVGIAQSLFDRDTVNGFVNTLTVLSNGIKVVVDNLGLLGTIGAGAGIAAFIKHLDSLKNMGNLFGDAGGSIKSFTSIKETISLLRSLGGTSFSGLEGLAGAFDVFKKEGELSVGIDAPKELPNIINNIGNGNSIEDVGNAIKGLSDKSKTAVLSLTNLGKEELTKEQAQLANSGDVDFSHYKAIEKQLKKMKEQENELSGEISDNISTIYENYNSLFDSAGNLVNGNEEIAQACEEVFAMMLNTSEVASQTEEAINGVLSKAQFAGVKDQLVDAASQGTDAFDAAFSNVVGLEEALANAGVSADDFKTTIMAIADNGLSDVTAQAEQLREAFIGDADSASEVEQRLSTLNEFPNGNLKI